MPATGDCANVTVSVRSVDTLGAFPLLLPTGGHRVSLAFRNDGDAPLEIAPANGATFVDDTGHALAPVMMPTEPNGWLMPFTAPAHATAVRTVTFATSAAPTLARIEVRANPPGSPFAGCTLRQTF